MNRRERVLRALRHEETDIIPFQIGLSSGQHEKMVRHTGDPDFLHRAGNHITMAGWNGGARPAEGLPGFYLDDFGTLWDRTGKDLDLGQAANIRLPEPSLAALEQFPWPKLDSARLHTVFRNLAESGADTFRLAHLGFTLFERAWILRGMQSLLMDMYLRRQFVERLLDILLEIDMQVLEIALGYGIDGVFFGDDWGRQRGLIMGPELWRALIKPRMARLYERVRRAGKFVIHHSCGDIQEIYPDLIEIGAHVHQTFQPEIYDMAGVKREYGRDLAFWGGISTQGLLPRATPEEIRREVRETLRLMGQGGGYIASPTHDVAEDVPAENILALLEVFQNQGRV
jgi:uroporphyrinogen decarboxylase